MTAIAVFKLEWSGGFRPQASGFRLLLSLKLDDGDDDDIDGWLAGLSLLGSWNHSSKTPILSSGSHGRAKRKNK